ncbi:hypothetical protein AB0L54_32990 [Streptomyces sp. NPDC052196]|uniref:hypothetical protein n=1 Tax=Streptomyces sp. NPDC052196 TaxID=3156691 RepID=UPI0034389AC0
MSPQRTRLRWNGQAATDAIRQAAARGVLLAAEHTLAASRQRVPISEGTLERSGAASVDTEQLTAAVSYDTPYAVRVHEDINARHLPGRSAKYLEGVLPEVAGDVQTIIGTQVRRALR